ncbi:MAG TPA: tRNA (adenosine(37)-N6)-threonylcarbamoyltransferase complex dimerization subunit type 1 TsaB [Candidatus Angelobacter sp.]|nr:tRNA (adenosine(37)-N6)-threonylcarbamoyltransferase complex dimerization subunit type 1 TsaB [Candidatus Angelobacter sp.]
MLVLAIDTCDSRGGVALLSDGDLLSTAEHAPGSDYSSWLLPAVTHVLQSAGAVMAEIGGYAVTAGPGSFTGVRVGLTTVKAWAEVYGKPIAAVSRLEAIAEQGPGTAEGIAAFVDAQRGQVFGAVYRREGDGLSRISDEMVIAPGKFLEEAARLAGEEKMFWLSPDPSHMACEPGWKEREVKGETIESVSAFLAPVIGRIGTRRLRHGQSVDALTLDANYVRRSDAEIFWKAGNAAHGR